MLLPYIWLGKWKQAACIWSPVQSYAVGVIDPSDNWGTHIKVCIASDCPLHCLCKCGHAITSFTRRKKTIPPHRLPHLSTWQCQTSITATLLSDTVENRQLAGDYWLGANATDVLNIYACEYPHFGFSGGLVVHDLQCKHRISSVKANLKRLVIILCNTCRSAVNWSIQVKTAVCAVCGSRKSKSLQQ